MTKNQLDIIFRTTLNWVACMTHATRTNEPFNPFFLRRRNIALLLYSLWVSLAYKDIKRLNKRVEDKVFNIIKD